MREGAEHAEPCGLGGIGGRLALEILERRPRRSSRCEALARRGQERVDLVLADSSGVSLTVGSQ